MTRYLISFGDGALDHIPDEEMPDVGKAVHAVMQEASGTPSAEAEDHRTIRVVMRTGERGTR
jgi:hypothetical protein